MQQDMYVQGYVCTKNPQHKRNYFDYVFKQAFTLDYQIKKVYNININIIGSIISCFKIGSNKFSITFNNFLAYQSSNRFCLKSSPKIKKLNNIPYPQPHAYPTILGVVPSTILSVVIFMKYNTFNAYSYTYIVLRYYC